MFATILVLMKRFTLSPQPKDYLQEIAEKAKFLRKQQGYTQAELAGRAKVSLGSLKRFEQSGEINLRSLLKLGQILGALEEFSLLFPPKREIKNRIAKLFEE